MASCMMCDAVSRLCGYKSSRVLVLVTGLKLFTRSVSQLRPGVAGSRFFNTNSAGGHSQSKSFLGVLLDRFSTTKAPPSSTKSHNVLGIALVSIIDRQLPFEYTIASRSTDVMVWNAVYDAHNEVACLMLGSMTPDLHGQLENSSPYEMLQELKFMFEKQAGVERFDLIQTFHACKQEEGKPIGPYVIKMKKFVRNYNMHNMGKTIGELHALLIEYGKGLPKKAATLQVMAIQGGGIQKANKKSLKTKGKGNGKGKGKNKSYIPKPKNPKPYAKEHPAKDDVCHHYKEVGHWKRNFPAYLAELIKKKKKVGTANSSSIFTIELFHFPKNSWVYDTGCGTHICNTKQGLRGERKLKQGVLRTLFQLSYSSKTLTGSANLLLLHNQLSKVNKTIPFPMTYGTDI
ncbi:hypothetical protein Tco_0785837 [Tanacetum coccineum]